MFKTFAKIALIVVALSTVIDTASADGPVPACFTCDGSAGN